MSLYLGDKKIAGAGGGGNANVVSCADYEEYLAVRGSYPEQTTFYTPDGPGSAGGCKAGEYAEGLSAQIDGLSSTVEDRFESLSSAVSALSQKVLAASGALDYDNSTGVSLATLSAGFEVPSDGVLFVQTNRFVNYYVQEGTAPSIDIRLWYTNPTRDSLAVVVNGYDREICQARLADSTFMEIPSPSSTSNFFCGQVVYTLEKELRLNKGQIAKIKLNFSPGNSAELSPNGTNLDSRIVFVPFLAES